MGMVTITARVAGSNGSGGEVDCVVDTGSFLTILSPAICERLHIGVPFRERVPTADNRPLEINVGMAHIEIDGRAAAVPVAEMDVPVPLLGVSALEALGFKVNPVEGTLEPTRPFPEIPAL
jgi:predicted aspartyl protease